MTEHTILDLDAILDIEMDKVETLPDFVTPPVGIYTLAVVEAKTEKYKSKPKNGQPAQEGVRIKILYRVEEVIECEDLPPKIGSLFSDSFMATEDGRKYFKRQAMNILNVKDLDNAKLRDVLDGLKDQVFKAKITIRRSRGDDGTDFENVQVRPFHVEAP